MKRFFRDNGLTVVLFFLFGLFLVGQTATGYRTYNHDQRDHHSPAVSFGEYLTSGHFGEAVFENWESEFLQMSGYILLTIWLRQRGSAESKKIDQPEDVDRDPAPSTKKNKPWPAKRGGVVLKLYENSLSLAFVLLFLMSFFLHGQQGTKVYNGEQKEHGGKPVSMMTYMRTSQFWFESLQNWQSEFLATGCIVFFSVYLRQKGSPESKPVDMANEEMP
ncbi:MAG: hypothetical protein QOG54_1188 [Actinomycetota bacterium]|jgi:hypothetical protein|nr:hypothetical protein [Actinomycetota bacterium]